MSGVAGVSSGVVNSAPLPPGEAAAPQALLPPSLGAGDPTDAMAMLMVSMQELSEMGLTESETRMRVNAEKMDEKLQEFVTKLAKAIEAARKAAEEAKDDGGWFSSVVDCVADVVGDVLGSVVDFAKDAVEAPFELGYAAITNPGDLSALYAAVKDQVSQLSSDGEWADSVDGFTEGAVKFAMDTAVFAAKLVAAMAQATLTGESAWDAMKDECKALWKSFQSNILENPAFWEVASVVGKAAAVGVALASGGVAAPVVIGVMLALEVDSRTGFIEDVVGPDAAPWVRIGLVAASTAVTLGAGGLGDAPQWLTAVKGAVTVLAGARDVNAAIKGMDAAAERRAEAKREAAIQETFNQLKALQRLQDDLMAVYQEQSQTKSSFMQLGQQLTQIQAANMSATLMRV